MVVRRFISERIIFSDKMHLGITFSTTQDHTQTHKPKARLVWIFHMATLSKYTLGRI